MAIFHHEPSLTNQKITEIKEILVKLQQKMTEDHRKFKLRYLRQTGTLAAYIDEFYELFDQITISESEAIDFFLEGLAPAIRDPIRILRLRELKYVIALAIWRSPASTYEDSKSKSNSDPMMIDDDRLMNVGEINSKSDVETNQNVCATRIATKSDVDSISNIPVMIITNLHYQSNFIAAQISDSTMDEGEQEYEFDSESDRAGASLIVNEFGDLSCDGLYKTTSGMHILDDTESSKRVLKIESAFSCNSNASTNQFFTVELAVDKSWNRETAFGKTLPLPSFDNVFHAPELLVKMPLRTVENKFVARETNTHRLLLMSVNRGVFDIIHPLSFVDVNARKDDPSLFRLLFMDQHHDTSTALIHERYVMRLRKKLEYEEKKQFFRRRVLSESESVRWLNHAVEKIWPTCIERIASQHILLPIIPWFLEKYKPWTAKKAVVQYLYLGRNAPLFTEMMVLRECPDDDHLVFEFGMNFLPADDMSAVLAVKLRKRLGFGIWAKLHIKGMHVEAKVLIGLKFLRQWLFLGRLRLYFVKPPYFQMILNPIFNHGLDVTEVSGISGGLNKLLSLAFEQTLVEPNMLIVDFEKFVSPQPENWFSVHERQPHAHAKIVVIEAGDIKPSNINGLYDPYVKELDAIALKLNVGRLLATIKGQILFDVARLRNCGSVGVLAIDPSLFLLLFMDRQGAAAGALFLAQRQIFDFRCLRTSIFSRRGYLL